jgi:hypothetical protein
MEKFQRIIAFAAIPLSISAMLLATVPASAATVSTATNSCSVTTVGAKNTTGKSDSRFKLGSDGSVSAQVRVTGDSDCEQAVTLASWKAPDALKGRPYSQQTLFAHTTETIGVGTHTISVMPPDCFYQVDLVKGTSPTAADGSSVYPSNIMLGSLHGGTQTCTVPTPPVTPTPPPATPTTPVTPTRPTALPNTGTGTAPFLAAIAATVFGIAFSYVRQLRKSRTASSSFAG